MYEEDWDDNIDYETHHSGPYYDDDYSADYDDDDDFEEDSKYSRDQIVIDSVDDFIVYTERVSDTKTKFFGLPTHKKEVFSTFEWDEKEIEEEEARQQNWHQNGAPQYLKNDFRTLPDSSIDDKAPGFTTWEDILN
jgi:hypothetical protein